MRDKSVTNLGSFASLSDRIPTLLRPACACTKGGGQRMSSGILYKHTHVRTLHVSYAGHKTCICTLLPSQTPDTELKMAQTNFYFCQCKGHCHRQVVINHRNDSNMFKLNHIMTMNSFLLQIPYINELYR